MFRPRIYWRVNARRGGFRFRADRYEEQRCVQATKGGLLPPPPYNVHTLAFTLRSEPAANSYRGAHLTRYRRARARYLLWDVLVP